MSTTNQGFTDLTNAVAEDTAEVQAEQDAFAGLEAAIGKLIAAGAGTVTDAQLEALAQSLQAAQKARADAVATATATPTA